jgi:transcriptional regulator with XRE-family HTH domain
MADLIGISASAYCRLERGQVNPRLRSLQNAALVLGCDLTDLIEEKHREWLPGPKANPPVVPPTDLDRLSLRRSSKFQQRPDPDDYKEAAEQWRLKGPDSLREAPKAQPPRAPLFTLLPDRRTLVTEERPGRAA